MNSLKYSQSAFDRFYAVFLLIIMSIQIVPIESLGISPIKISVLALSVLVFIFYANNISKALILCMIYWIYCFFSAAFNPDFRFSTIAYLGLFLISYIVYYNLVYRNIFTVEYFRKILKTIIYLFCIVLIFQQLCVLVGLKNVPFINLVGADYYAWNRLPILTCEPSHTARIVVATMLGYLRCTELEVGRKVTLKFLFDREHRYVALSYLWITFTMGSGTVWIGFLILCLYFIKPRNFLYIIPLIICIFLFLNFSKNEQFHRAKAAAMATLSGSVQVISDTDLSAAYRIVPLVNTFTQMDLSKKESWFGNGTMTDKEADDLRLDLTKKIGIVEQYGLLGLLFSLLIVYCCAIRSIFSIETLLFIFLYGLSLGNIYIVWSAMYIFTTIKYFSKQTV